MSAAEMQSLRGAAAGRARASAGVESAVPVIATGVVIGWILVKILQLNDGRFFYSLDDPYIHLAMAENIARGHYGVNLEGYAAASSSILWPFLLAPFAGLALQPWLPLLINTACTLATVLLLQRALRLLLPDAVPQAALYRACLTLAIVFGLNLVGLLFTGMEHSLQVLLAVLVAYGLIRFVEVEPAVPWWLAAAILAGPLVRYENAALSLAALFFLSLQGRRALALGLAAALVAALLGYSLFLIELGLGWLPTSILVKQEAVGGAGLGSRLLEELLALAGRPERINDLVLRLLALALLVGALRRSARPELRLLSALGFAAVLAHLLFGQTARFPRYAIYAFAAAGLLALYRYRDGLAAVTRRLPAPAGLAGLAAVTLLLFPANILATAFTPAGASNMFEQQYQMHRVATEVLREPVAVNDLGLVSFRNDRHVADLYGLAWFEAAQQRFRGDPGWMRRLLAGGPVRLAMIYHDWFYGQIPARWVELGRLRLGREALTASRDTVTFYATSAAHAADLRAKLKRFAATLPAGARFDWAKPGADRRAGFRSGLDLYDGLPPRHGDWHPG